MRNWITLVESHTGIDFDEPPFVTQDGEINYPARVDAVLDAIERFVSPLPIRAEMQPYKNRYTGDIQGVVLTDFYADVPGDGNGTKVMQMMIDIANAAAINIYTDAEGPRSKIFYEKFGFERDAQGGHMLVHYAPIPDDDD